MAVTTAVALRLARRFELAALPTPLHETPRLAKAIGLHGRLLVKRDDLTGFAVAGNKARPLEFLVAEALERGADVLVTGGAPASNYCQAAAAAAAFAGLDCVLVYAGSPGRVAGVSGGHPNCAAASHWGAETRWTGDPDRASVDAGIERVADELSRAGRTPFTTPRGGASAVGTLGFHLAARELHDQLAGPAIVVVAAGSGGTIAGLVSGAAALGRDLRIRGASVSRPPDETRERVLRLACAGSDLLGTRPPAATDVVIEDARGAGHGIPSAEGERAAAIALRTAGLVLDPVYTAKALGALPRILGEQREDPAPDHCFLAYRGAARCGRRMGANMTHDGLPSAPSQHHVGGLDRLGPPVGGPAQELIDSGFALENADAPLLHAGLNLADLAHVIDLHERGVIPGAAARQIVRVVLRAMRTTAEDFPYDPAFGEPYNSRERYFTSQIGDDAGWLHAGRPRREAVRIALRLNVRSGLEDVVEAAAELALAIAEVAGAHSRTWLPDQTYLQHAQPSTFGHYLASFAYPVLRDAERLIDAFTWVNTSPGGAGCVNGSRLLEDRTRVAGLLGFDGVIEHTRDAMWQIDGLIAALSNASSLLTTQSKLAEDLEIWASNEFDYVTIADGYSRSSVLMPQKL